jgi:hypothetical protein
VSKPPPFDSTSDEDPPDVDTAELPQLDLQDIAFEFDDDQTGSRESRRPADEMDAVVQALRADFNKLADEKELLTSGLASRDETIARLEAEIEELRRSPRQEAETAGEPEPRRRDKDDPSGPLRLRVQDLENYIEGRRSRWLEQEAKLEEQRRLLQDMADITESQQRQFAAKEKENAAYQARLQDLEKELAHSLGQSSERNQTAQEFRNALQEQVSLVAQLRTELAAREQQLIELEAAKSQSAPETGKGTEDQDGQQESPRRRWRNRKHGATAQLSIEAAELFAINGSGIIEAMPGARESAQDGIRRMLVLKSGNARTIHLLTRDKLTIGRSARADVSIPDPTISRRHASLVQSDEGTVIEDAGSTNGVLVNGVRVKRAVLHDGDTVNLAGSLNLTYVETPATTELDKGN